MPTTKTITITCDGWDAPRLLDLTPSLTTAQILRQFDLDPTGALVHERTTTDRRSGLTARETWMGRDKPYKKVIAGDVLTAIQWDVPQADDPADRPEPAFDPCRPSQWA